VAVIVSSQKRLKRYVDTPYNPILSFSFGANERTKENIHLLQDLPLYGEDVIDFGQRPPSIKVLA